MVPSVDYQGLTDAMFHMIRQNAASNPAILMRLIEVLTAVVSCESDPGRIHSLERHADLALRDAERTVLAPSDLGDVRDRHVMFASAKETRTAAVDRAAAADSCSGAETGR